MVSIKTEDWDPGILDRGYICTDGQKIYLERRSPHSIKFRKKLEILSKELKRKIRKLSILEKRCIRMYYFSNPPITQKGIAKKLKISRESVKLHLRRGIERLKLMYKEKPYV